MTVLPFSLSGELQKVKKCGISVGGVKFLAQNKKNSKFAI
jgi:hypothetical protein